ncbi:MAG: hypothetical protein ACTH4Y_11480 [Microbacterium gubbeenense]|uniref:hypothetical protein n=1 Tax=Microbacterium gubbeenense TaxID=159896 RepID=UPI003F967375
MGFQFQTEGNIEDQFDEAQSGGGGSFPPLPAGRYQAEIVPLKKDGSQLVETVEFSKNNPAYAGKQGVRVALRIVDDSPTGAKRQYFTRVPLFTQWASGKTARPFFNFFGAVGATKEDFKRGQLPGPEDFMGKRVSLTLSDPIEPDNWNPLGSNDVAWINPAGTIADTPVRRPGVTVAPWLTPDDELTPEFAAAQGAGQPSQGAAPAQASWESAASPWASSTPEASNVTTGPWSKPQGDGLQAAANSGKSF